MAQWRGFLLLGLRARERAPARERRASPAVQCERRGVCAFAEPRAELSKERSHSKEHTWKAMRMDIDVADLWIAACSMCQRCERAHNFSLCVGA